MDAPFYVLSQGRSVGRDGVLLVAPKLIRTMVATEVEQIDELDGCRPAVRCEVGPQQARCVL